MNAVITVASHAQLPFRALHSMGRSAAEQRLNALVIQHRQLVLRSLRRLGISERDADDVAQRVFLVVARKLDIIEPGRERAYVLGIATRIASEVRRVEARRQRREVSLELDNDAASEERTDDLLELKRTRVLLDQLLSAMPEDLTRVFVLAEGEGLTANEISRRVGIPVGTVASRLRRARSFFQRKASQLGAPRSAPRPLRGARPPHTRSVVN